MNIKSKITDELKEEVALLLKQERNLVVKERLTYISMYVNGITKRDIANMVGRTKETVGTWINKYFKDGIEAIADNKMVVEINTAGIRKKVNEIYPSINLLEMLKEYNIDITFGSDAHSPNQVGFYLKEAIKIAKNIGFKEAVYFENREKFKVKL